MKEQRIGRYKLIKHIASGGMADVYLAVMTGPYGFEKTVALKLMHKHLSEDQSFMNMFVNEARISAKLVHPNIVQILDFGETDKHLYIAMEYVNGVDLSIFINALISQNIKPCNEIAIYITTQILNAICYTSLLKDKDGDTANIVHRDITPHNILLSFDSDVKLTDFGIAKARGSITTTLAGTLKGKIRYMSPEQARGEIIDYRSDLYSIGLILYELLTHKQAFSGDTDMTLLKHVQASMIDCLPTLINPDISPILEKTIMKALSASPENRFQTAEAFKQSLFESCPDYLSARVQLSNFLKELFNNQTSLNIFIHSSDQDTKNKPYITKKKSNTLFRIKWFLISASIVMICVFILYNGSIRQFRKPYTLSSTILIDKNTPPSINKNNTDRPDTKDVFKTPVKPANNKPTLLATEHTQNKQRVSYSTVEINAIPWANVYIADNRTTRFIGITPIKDYSIPAGRYAVIFKNKIYGEKTVNIDIPPKDKKTIILKYDPLQKRAITSIH